MSGHILDTKRAKLALPEASVSRVSWLNLHSHIPQKDIRKLIYTLLSPEDREVVACAHNTRRVPDLTEHFPFYCARNGFIELLDWACSKECQVSEAVFEVAAEEGQWKVLQWGLQNDCVFEEAVCMKAALDGGHLDLFKWGRRRACWFMATFAALQHDMGIWKCCSGLVLFTFSLV
jgi:hypothetical protein